MHVPSFSTLVKTLTTFTLLLPCIASGQATSTGTTTTVITPVTTFDGGRMDHDGQGTGEWGISLPLEGLSFSAKAEASQVRLYWESLNEQDLKYYRVQRSTDGTNYTIVATVISKGNGSHRYQYADASPVAGTAYYRIQSIGNNGTFNYSETVPVSMSLVLSDVRLSPIPATGIIRINRNSTSNGTATCLDGSGKVLLKTALGEGETSLDISTLPAGNYFMLIESEGGRWVKQFVHQ